MTANTYIFLSDIHIGINDKTSWYQKTVHENNLKAILRYIQNNAQRIQDLVILGDWFDLWTYPPSDQPPQLMDIFNANQAVFSTQSDQSGDFITCLNSIQGDFHYINGNHDLTVSCDDINRCFENYGAKDRKIVGNPNPRENIIYKAGDIYALHGHEPYSLFCRPDDEDSRYEALPLGYFISRTVGKICEQKLDTEHKANAALLPDSGNPVFSVEAAAFGLKHLVELASGKETFAQALLYALVDRTGMSPEKVEYTLYDGSTQTAPQAAELFSKLSITNEEDFHAMVNDATNTLSTPAAKLRQAGHKVVIMGHTHVPELMKSGIADTRGIYANSGFNCPDQPGMKDGKLFPTFIEVEKNGSGCSVHLQKVDYPLETVSTLHTETI
jgi:UDP-2,3-diacylglucosamine pyrophosphatase LpxH